MIKKVKNTVPWAYVINDLNVEEIVRAFNKKELQKTIRKEFRIEKVIKRKGDKIYVKWKGYDLSLFGQNYFNNDGAQLYLIFQPSYKIITTFFGLPFTISEWESNGLPNENFKPPYTANKSFSQKLLWNISRLRLDLTEAV